MKLATIVGARPQFVKAAMVSRAIREYNDNCEASLRLEELLIHTGQHYDFEMSQVFFDQLDLPSPYIHLGIGSGTHGEQTASMLSSLEQALIEASPDAVLVYGDTNSTLAGALAAAKLNIPIGHVEGGMRSFNRKMPEEINRVLTDHVANWHFCATQTAINNLLAEGVNENVLLVGDVMLEAVNLYQTIAEKKSNILSRLALYDSRTEKVKPFGLVTLHRAENVDDDKRIGSILDALIKVSKDIELVFTIHPRTRKAMETHRLKDNLDVAASSGRIKLIDPLPYLDMIRLEEAAELIFTDSGGVQKEAYWLGTPCVTLRDETEWVETVERGWNAVVGADSEKILLAARVRKGSMDQPKHVLGNEQASQKIILALVSQFREAK